MQCATRSVLERMEVLPSCDTANRQGAPGGEPNTVQRVMNPLQKPTS